MTAPTSPTIVVGFDGSARGEDAIELGSLLADLLSARMLAVCAWSRPALSGSGDALTQVLREEAERIAGQAARMASTPIDAAIAVEELAPARALAHVAAEYEAVLVVVGSSHRGALGRLAVGSVPERLLHEDGVAVAVAPAGYVTGEPPALSSVGVGFDGSPSSQAALALAAILARAAHVPLRVFGVIGPELVGPFPATLNTDARAAHIAAVRAREQIALEHAVEELRGGGLEIVIEPRLGDPASSLEARSRELGLLVLGSHGYSALRRILHNSVSTHLTRAAACPLIVVPPSSKLVRTAAEQAATPRLRTAAPGASVAR